MRIYIGPWIMTKHLYRARHRWSKSKVNLEWTGFPYLFIFGSSHSLWCLKKFIITHINASIKHCTSISNFVWLYCSFHSSRSLSLSNFLPQLCWAVKLNYPNVSSIDTRVNIEITNKFLHERLYASFVVVPRQIKTSWTIQQYSKIDGGAT